MGHPLPPALWLGFPFPGWGLTGGLQAQQLQPCPLSSWPLGFIPRSFPFTPQPKAMTKPLPGQWHHSSGLSRFWGVPPDQWQSLKRPCQPMAALLGLPWANDVASSTLCPSSMRAHCREGDWDQKGGDMGSPIFGRASEWVSPHLPTQFNCA